MREIVYPGIEISDFRKYAQRMDGRVLGSDRALYSRMRRISIDNVLGTSKETWARSERCALDAAISHLESFGETAKTGADA